MEQTKTLNQKLDARLIKVGKKIPRNVKSAAKEELRELVEKEKWLISDSLDWIVDKYGQDK